MSNRIEGGGADEGEEACASRKYRAQRHTCEDESAGEARTRIDAENAGVGQEVGAVGEVHRDAHEQESEDEEQSLTAAGPLLLGDVRLRGCCICFCCWGCVWWGKRGHSARP
nr:hypothetical protein [Corynebacterium macginleyi]